MPDLKDDANKVAQDLGAKAVAWFQHPVPVWAVGVAILLGLVFGHFGK